MNDENRKLLMDTASLGLVALATEALKQLDRRIALGILDKIDSGRSAFSFGVRITGRGTEIVAHVVEGTDSMHLVTINSTAAPDPVLN